MTRLLVILFLLSASQAHAQEWWKPVFKGKVDAFYATSPDTVYVALRDSIHRSVDGGSNWSFYKEVPIPDDSSLGNGYHIAYRVEGFGVNHESKVILSVYEDVSFYIGAGTRSTFLFHEDSVVDWRFGFSTQVTPVRQFSFYPDGGAVGFGGWNREHLNDGMFLGASLYWSSNDGLSWDERFLPRSAVAITLTTPTRLYVVEERRDSILDYSIDTGIVWLNDTLDVQGGEVSAIELLPNLTAIIATKSGMFLSENTMSSFSKVSSITDVTAFYSNLEGIIYAAGTQLYRSKSRGETWEPLGVKSLSNIQALGDSTLYALEHDTLFKLTSETLDVGVYSEEGSRIPYPNPCQSILVSPIEVDWYDALGCLVNPSFQRSTLGYVYDVQLLPRGVYFLRDRIKSSKVVLH